MSWSEESEKKSREEESDEKSKDSKSDDSERTSEESCDEGRSGSKECSSRKYKVTEILKIRIRKEKYLII